MHVAFRVDASLQIGTGHVMRCLTLADELRRRGARCSFVCRPHEGHLLALVAQRGHQALALPELQEGAQPNRNGTEHARWLGTDWTTDAQDTQQALNATTRCQHVDWLVVDHYALDVRWEHALRSQATRIMVIDDLADRPHACDLLLDQNLGRSAQDYCGLLKGKNNTLIGPQYALLRPEFAALRAQSIARRQSNTQLSSLLVTMGGVDKDNATGQVLTELQSCNLPADLRVTVVMGPHAPWLAQVQAQATQMPWHTEVLVGVNNMAQLMAESDLAIGAAGSTSWEFCCLGIPSLLICTADNQRTVIAALASNNASVSLDSFELGQSDCIPFKKQYTRITENLSIFSATAARITDGNGASRVCKEML